MCAVSLGWRALTPLPAGWILALMITKTARRRTPFVRVVLVRSWTSQRRIGTPPAVCRQPVEAIIRQNGALDKSTGNAIMASVSMGVCWFLPPCEACGVGCTFAEHADLIKPIARKS